MQASIICLQFVTCLVAVLVSAGLAQFLHDFTYIGKHGPDHWAEQFRTCAGKHQSPININVFDVINKSLWPIDINRFDRQPQQADVHNNGHTVMVHLNYKNQSKPSIMLGPLEGIGMFDFAQLHFHWGPNNTAGSEDRINNISFPAELHVVFYNDKYDSLDKAALQNDGVAVMAFFFKLQKADNPKYTELIDLLLDIKEPGSRATFIRPPSLADLIVKDLNNYFTYTGSLTTPPCSENVVWMDFMTPIAISYEQIEAFRHLNTHSGKPLTHNVRPLQPVNNRTIFRPISYPIFPFVNHQVVSSIPFMDDINGASRQLGPTASVSMPLLVAIIVGALIAF